MVLLHEKTICETSSEFALNSCFCRVIELISSIICVGLFALCFELSKLLKEKLKFNWHLFGISAAGAAAILASLCIIMGMIEYNKRAWIPDYEDSRQKCRNVQRT
ncbi:hypothetical protein CDAR_588671 [Caerostris darwini]|uniref:Uncharacterized protein n=1 Tax=Caerostris darwini TaxID=1538125 RepID=A0AAV4UV53_9ARAC|nr:hypothetical protein CDAR_588671 [Caerostris darwini]